MLVKEKCPRWGYSELHSENSVYLVETKCKTWRCKVCRSSLLNLVKMRIEYGCLELGQSYFITLTLPAGRGQPIRDAAYVRSAWEQSIRKLKQEPGYAGVAWLKVPELTKKGQPHLHLIVGGIGTPVAMCKKFPKYSPEWISQRCDCLAHKFGWKWYQETGAYVIDCQVVYNPRGIGAYVAKYVTKGFMIRDAMESAGFLRRFSMSRNFPRGERLRLRGTDEGWRRVSFRPPSTYYRGFLERKVEADSKRRKMERLGDDLTLFFAERNRKLARKAQLRKVVEYGNASISNEPMVRSGNHCR